MFCSSMMNINEKKRTTSTNKLLLQNGRLPYVKIISNNKFLLYKYEKKNPYRKISSNKKYQ